MTPSSLATQPVSEKVGVGVADKYMRWGGVAVGGWAAGGESDLGAMKQPRPPVVTSGCPPTHALWVRVAPRRCLHANLVSVYVLGEAAKLCVSICLCV